MFIDIFENCSNIKPTGFALTFRLIMMIIVMKHYWPRFFGMKFMGCDKHSEPNFYFTYDIDETLQEATISSMLGAMDEFGNTN